MNDKMELEEAVTRLTRDITKPLACGDICVVSISDVETVLQALENSIPKEKIENEIEELKNILRGKQAIFVGHSGVGKSSLTNAIMDAEDIKTSSVSKKSGKGRHTTTTSKYYIWDEKSSIIDTPGIRSLDISNFELDEIKEFFSEFQVWEEKCKFSNCLHYKEPEAYCFVKQAVKAGIISKERYDSYVRILSDIADEREKEDDGITK